MTCGLGSLPHLMRQTQTLEVEQSTRHDRRFPEKSIPKNSMSLTFLELRLALM